MSRTFHLAPAPRNEIAKAVRIRSRSSVRQRLDCASAKRESSLNAVKNGKIRTWGQRLHFHDDDSRSGHEPERNRASNACGSADPGESLRYGFVLHGARSSSLRITLCCRREGWSEPTNASGSLAITASGRGSGSSPANRRYSAPMIAPQAIAGISRCDHTAKGAKGESRKTHSKAIAAPFLDPGIFKRAVAAQPPRNMVQAQHEDRRRDDRRDKNGQEELRRNRRRDDEREDRPRSTRQILEIARQQRHRHDGEDRRQYCRHRGCNHNACDRRANADGPIEPASGSKRPQRDWSF